MGHAIHGLFKIVLEKKTHEKYILISIGYAYNAQGATLNGLCR